MKTKSFSFLAILVLLFSCGRRENELAFPFWQEISLAADSIYINEIVEIDEWVQVDTLLCIKSSKTDTILYMYSLPSVKLVESIGLKGRGPDEYLYPHIAGDHRSHLYIYDNGNKKFKTLQISEKGCRVQSENILNQHDIINTFGHIEDSLFYFKEENPRLLSVNLNVIGLNGAQSVSSLKIIEDPTGMSHKKDFVVTNNQRDVVIAYLHQKKIEFYKIDERNKFQKTITYTDRKDIDVDKYQYIDISSCGNYIYVLYAGLDEQKIFSNNFVSTVEIFSKEGEAKMRLKLDRMVTKIIIGKDGKNLYAVSPFVADYIYKYELMQ